MGAKESVFRTDGSEVENVVCAHRLFNNPTFTQMYPTSYQ